ncbi:MAG: hypothetical protein R3324_15115, partial [Halobacteriales archaeon]|nr:hypothetical protein [Halobacteriales archaeon]
MSGPDFTFTAPASLNRDVVEDDPAGIGHRVVVRRVFDSDGVNITGQVDNSATLNGLYFDFTGPVPGPAALVEVDDDPFIAGRLYNEGELTVRDVSELGVGGLEVTVDILVGAGLIQADVTRVEDVPERKAEYVARPGSMVDLLGNAGDVSGIASTSMWGVDKTPLSASLIRPANSSVLLNPTDDAGDGTSDNQLQFTLSEPALADGSAGAGFRSATLIGEEAEGVVYNLTTRISPNSLGANLVDVSGVLDDGDYTFTLEMTDNALPGNVSTQEIAFSVDDTDPLITLDIFPPGEVNPAGSGVGLQIGGFIVDASGFLSASITIRTTGGDTECDLTDPIFPAGSDPGDVDRNSVDILNSVDDFSEIFNFTRDPGQTQIVCLWIEARDLAEDVFGNSEPNINRAFSKTTINW